MPHFFQASDGNRLAYYVDDYSDPWKPKRTLLLLHAAMGSARRWYGMVPALCRHYRVIRLDLRGHGESQVPPEDPPLSLDRLVQDAREVLAEAGVAGPLHVVGNSAGGYIAQQLAMRSPELVRSLILFGSTPGLKNSQAHTWLPRVARDGLRTFLAETIEDRFPAGHDKGNVEWFLDEAAKNDSAYIVRFVSLMASQWWMDDLPAIRCPTLMVVPGAETVGHAGDYDRMAALISGSEILRYPGLPHNICDIVPDRCAADVLAWLDRRFPQG
jgi:3-oxoadipate enol-lactonase